MNVDIITIGDEILIGQIIDTNSAWMARQLNAVGASVRQISSISDGKDHILKTLSDSLLYADVVLVTGGLGPTNDDVTKETLCSFFNVGLRFDEEVFGDIERLFEAKGLQVNEINRKQAEVLENCKVLRNKLGTAPGMWFEYNGKIVVSMPGVPYEMKAMMSDFVISGLLEKFETKAIVHKTVITEGIGESFLAEMIQGWEEAIRKRGIKLAYLPSPGIVKLRLSMYGKEKELVEKAIDLAIEEIKPLISEHYFGVEVYGEEKQGPAAFVGELLIKQGKTLSTAESCTGGYIAHLITSIPGSSEYFKGTVVSYDNEVKIEQLGVRREDIIDHGSVSKEVVEQMAKGVRELLKTDYALATSGVAGPGGGKPGKPVGTEWVAMATADKVISRKFLFGEDRVRNIRKAALASLAMLQKELSTTTQSK